MHISNSACWMGVVPEAVHLNNDQSEGAVKISYKDISHGSIIVVCSEFQCTSTLANSLHGMEDYAHHQCVAIFVH